MNRRQFIAGIGSFFILPGAGRLWKATLPPVIYRTTTSGVLVELRSITTMPHTPLNPSAILIESMDLDFSSLFDELYSLKQRYAMNRFFWNEPTQLH